MRCFRKKGSRYLVKTFYFFFPSGERNFMKKLLAGKKRAADGVRKTLKKPVNPVTADADGS
jgi:hypothetical protein